MKISLCFDIKYMYQHPRAWYWRLKQCHQIGEQMALFSFGGSVFFFFFFHVDMPKTPSLSSVSVSLPSRETSAAQTSFEGFYRNGVKIAFDSLGMCRISCGAGRGGGALERLQGPASGTDLNEMHAHPVRRVWARGGWRALSAASSANALLRVSLRLFSLTCSSFYFPSQFCRRCCALTVSRVSAKLPERESAVWMLRLYF